MVSRRKCHCMTLIVDLTDNLRHSGLLPLSMVLGSVLPTFESAWAINGKRSDAAIHVRSYHSAYFGRKMFCSAARVVHCMCPVDSLDSYTNAKALMTDGPPRFMIKRLRISFIGQLSQGKFPYSPPSWPFFLIFFLHLVYFTTCLQRKQSQEDTILSWYLIK